MAESPADEGTRLAREHLGPGAVARVRLFRNMEDSFVLDVESTSKDAPAFRSDDFLRIVPAGSTWDAALGWRSFFLHSCFIGDTDWWLLGVESVVRHATRGSYPILEGHVHRSLKSAADGIKALSKAIGPAVGTTPIDRGTVFAKSEHYLLSDATNPSAMAPDEAAILLYTYNCIAENVCPLMRTLALSVSRLPFNDPAKPEDCRAIVGLVRPISIRLTQERNGSSAQQEATRRLGGDGHREYWLSRPLRDKWMQHNDEP